MNRILSVFLCIFAFGLTLFFHIDKSNELTTLRLAIPQIEKEVKKLKLENEKLKYQIEQFESPIHLLELSKKPEYSHLKYPLISDVLQLSRKGAKDEE